jgi:ubiquitin-activating enzyme E1
MNDKINNNFYSRQIGTYGLETMTKIMKMNVFIYGMRGVGIEIAKNIVLAGPKSLTIFDSCKTKINDLSSNFFLKEEDVQEGKKRDEACFSNLSELNPYVKLNIMEGEDIISDIKNKIKNPETKYNVVLITEFLPKKEIIEINDICRNNNIGFIFSIEFGIFGFLFVDFGDEFIVYDETGEESKEYLIKLITKEKEGKVLINSNLSGNITLTSKDLVSFKEIEGMKELNNCPPRAIKINGNIIEIGDTSNFSDYISGGIIYNVKLPKKINFNSFKERVEIPIKEGEEYIGPLDFINVNIQEILAIGLLSLFDFYEQRNNLPEINNSNDAEDLYIFAKNILNKKEKENIYWVKNIIRRNIEDYDVNFDLVFEKIIKYLSNWAKAEICPIASFIGGVTAQEIIKFTGKYKPIHQWLYFDFSQIVENLNINNTDRKMLNTRYDDQIAIFGNEIQNKLANTNIFMIGAGALGCEFLKTFSTMGISTKNNKKLYVTDNDNIEISNLNRQFLFNKSSIGKSKSEVACKSIKKINEFFNCVPFQTRVCPENENFFDEEFWNKQDYIINAVDNIKARIYIAQQSLIYKKTLIDSGTLGTKANSQIIIPHKTIPYSPPEEKEDKIPMCTLADHPFNIIHCIEWAKDNFDGYFVNILKEVKMFLENRDNYYNYIKKEYITSEQLEKIKTVFEYSKIFIEKNFEKCVELGLKQYNKNFNDKILDLIAQHGKDSLNEEGTKYWTGDKRFPHPIPFTSENK